MKTNPLLPICILLISVFIPTLVWAQGTACGETDYNCQLKALRERLKSNPRDIETYYNMGVVFQRTGSHKEAVEMFNMYLAVGVEDAWKMADGYNNRGISQSRLGNLDLAIKDYTKAIELAPGDPKPYVNRANAYRDLKNYDQAIIEYSKAAGVKPTYANAYIGRGHIYMLKNDAVRALADFTKSIEVDPNESEAYYNRGTLYFGQREYEKAIPDYDKYISLNQASPAGIADGHMNRGISYLSLGNVQKAIDDFTRVIEIDPKRINGYKGRAIAYRQIKKDELAAADEKKAAELGGQK